MQLSNESWVDDLRFLGGYMDDFFRGKFRGDYGSFSYEFSSKVSLYSQGDEAIDEVFISEFDEVWDYQDE